MVLYEYFLIVKVAFKLSDIIPSADISLFKSKQTQLELDWDISYMFFPSRLPFKIFKEPLAFFISFFDYDIWLATLFEKCCQNIQKKKKWENVPQITLLAVLFAFVFYLFTINFTFLQTYNTISWLFARVRFRVFRFGSVRFRYTAVNWFITHTTCTWHHFARGKLQSGGRRRGCTWYSQHMKNTFVLLCNTETKVALLAVLGLTCDFHKR